MVVQHNLTAMNSNRMLGLTTKSQAKSTEKLSSGYKINRAADDAAGLAISEKMRKQIRGLTQASLNAQDGISAVQTAEGALTEVHDMLQRMNELAVKSANGTNSDDDRSYIQAEIDQLVTEIDRVAETTKFNETYLLKGDEAAGTKNVYSYKEVTTAASAEITAGTTLYDAAGNAIADADALIAALKADPDAKFFTNQPTEAVAGTDYKDISTYTITGTLYDSTGTALTVGTIEAALKGNGAFKVVGVAAVDGTDNVASCPVDLYDEDGNVVYNAGDDTSGLDATAIGKLYTTAPQKAVAGTDYTKTSAYENITGKEVFDADGNKLDSADKLKAVLDAGGKGYTSAPDPAVAGTDFKYTPSSTGKAKLYDENGKEVSASSIADMIKNGDKLYADAEQKTEVTEAELGNYTEKTTVNEDLELSLHVGADSTDNNKITLNISSMSAAGIGVKGLDISSKDTASQAIDTISEALKQVSKQRSDLGAIQNRLEHTINNLDNVVENTTAAESQIRDTDMATEMVKYSNNNILAQAGQAMLAQANQTNQGVLSLLQ